MNNWNKLVIATIISSSPCCKKNSDVDCYKLHASVLHLDYQANAYASLEIFDALEKNTPEGREEAMLILSAMIEQYPSSMTELGKPPYNLKDESPISARVDAFLRDKKALVQSIRDSVNSRADSEISSPGVQRRLSTPPKLPGDS